MVPLLIIIYIYIPLYPIKNTFSYPIKKPCSSHHQPDISPSYSHCWFIPSLTTINQIYHQIPLGILLQGGHGHGDGRGHGAWSSAGASGVAMASCNSPTDPGGATEMLRQNGIDIMGYIYMVM